MALPTAKIIETPAVKTPAVETPAVETPAVETPAVETPAVETPAVEGEVYTYVGAGDGSPYVINFMGQQEFTRGKATVVTNPALLAKLPGASTFVKGEVEPTVLHEIDQTAKAAYDAKIAEDKVINARFQKKHAGE